MSKLTIKDENFYTVQGWMRNRLGLKGNALDLYAIIYGFSQVSHQEFTASVNYLCEWLGASRPTVINNLKDLVEKGLLTKESTTINGVMYNRYTAVVPNFIGGKEILPTQLKNFTGNSKEILLNNIDNTIEDKKESKKEETFNEIMDNSIESEKIKEVLVEFIKMRKLIKKPLTNRALKNIISKLKKLAGNDDTLAVAILDQSITNSWQDIYTLKEDYTIRKTIKSDAISNPETGKVTKVY